MTLMRVLVDGLPWPRGAPGWTASHDPEMCLGGRPLMTLRRVWEDGLQWPRGAPGWTASHDPEARLGGRPPMTRRRAWVDGLPWPWDTPGWTASHDPEARLGGHPPMTPRRVWVDGLPESPWEPTARPWILKQSICLLYTELTKKSTKNSYLILFLSKDWLKHHGKYETLSVNLRWRDDWMLQSFGNCRQKALYVVRTRTNF